MLDMLDIDWKGLALPCAYLLVLGGVFATFSNIYRRRKAYQSANLKAWFPPNLQRNIYLSLLHQTNDDDAAAPSDEKAAAEVPKSILRAALLRRAVEDMGRLAQLRSGRQAITSLLARGCVGDDLWQRFQRAEKEMEAELRDVVTEANALGPNWGQSIFQSAHEIANNTRLRQRLEEIQARTDSEREWWEKRRAAIETEFMKELDGSDRAGNGAAAVEKKGKSTKG